jgi:hypothetical protein
LILPDAGDRIGRRPRHRRKLLRRPPPAKGGYAENQVVTMIIRYQDEYARTPDGWRMARRKEIVDWTEVGTVQGGRRE